LSKKALKQLRYLCLILLLTGCKSAIQIDQLIFHTSICFGTCPVYHLQINGDRNVKLYAENVYNAKKGFHYEQDSNKIGYFTGKLSEADFNSITIELNRINFDTLQSDSSLCCDGSIKTIILYHKGERKAIKTMFEPALLEPLIGKLYQICSGKDFKRTTTAFTIEGSAQPAEVLPPDPADQQKFYRQ
jgi:hypothetical protein